MPDDLENYLDLGIPLRVPQNQLPQSDSAEDPINGDTTDLSIDLGLPELDDDDVPEPDGVYEDDQLGPNYYQDYRNDTWYETDQGMRVIPVSDSDPSVDVPHAVVRVHRPITTKIVEGSAQRLNEKPDIPSADTKNKNEILMKRTVGFADPLQLPNGKIWRASWRYVYRLQKPLTEEDIYPTGTSPYAKAESEDNFYGPEDFDEDLLDAEFALDEEDAATIPEVEEEEPEPEDPEAGSGPGSIKVPPV